MKTIKSLSLVLALGLAIAFDARALTDKVKQYSAANGFFSCVENFGQYPEFVTGGCSVNGQSVYITNSGGVKKILLVNQVIERNKPESELDTYQSPKLAHINSVELAVGEIEKVEFTKPIETKSNYFLGNDHTKWRTNVTNYSELVVQLVSGDQIVFYAESSNLRFDVIKKSAGAFSFELIGGETKIDEHGNLVLSQDKANLSIEKAICYNGDRKSSRSELNDSNKFVCDYSLDSDGGRLVTVGANEASSRDSYVIDPGVVWLTLFGNTPAGYVIPSAVEVADDGGVIIVGGAGLGATLPAPSAGVWSVGNPASTAFATKFTADGSALAWNTYFGGSGDDTASALTIDKVSGDIVIAGSGSSSNFPTTVGAFDTSYNNGTGDAYILRLNSTATTLIFSTYLGGNDYDGINSVKIGLGGNILFAGETKSSNFPIMNAYQNTRMGTGDAVMGKMAANGASLISSSYLGGTETSGFNYDKARDIVETSTGDLVVVGFTYNSSFPISASGVVDSTFNGSSTLAEGFVFKWVGGSGISRTATYIGGAGAAPITSINILSDNSFALIGATLSSSFQTTLGAIDTTFAGSNESFFVRISSALNIRLYSTMLGGTGIDSPTTSGNISAVLNDSIIFCANSTSSNLPTTLGSYDTTFAHVPTNPSNYKDAYLVKMTPNLSGTYDLQYLTYLGSSVGNDYCNGLHVKENGNIVITGETNWVSGNPNNLQATTGAYSNAGQMFVTEIDMLPAGVSKYGISSDTSLSGMTPTIDVNSSPTSGNTSFGIQLWGAAPNSYCVLGASVFPDVLGTDFYGLKWHLSLAWGLAGILFLPDFALPMLTDAAGNLTLPLSLPLGISGLQVCFQWYCFDPALNLTASNALDVVFQ